MKRVFILLLLLPTALFATQKIEVVPLSYQSADAIMKQLKPLLSDNEKVSGLGFKLIIQASEERLTALKTIIDEIDVQPKQYYVALRQAARSGKNNSGTGQKQTIQYRSRDGYVTGSAQVRQYNTRGRSNLPSMQQLRLLEGNWGLIQVGRSIPLAEREVQHTPWGSSVEQRVRYKDVLTGFEVMAQRSGESSVTLTISPQRNMVGSAGTIHHHSLETHVTTPLGQWVEIGSNLDELEASFSGRHYATIDRGWSSQRIEIYIDELK